MEKLSDKIEKINNKENFIDFVRLLIDDLNNNRSSWENKTLESYLEGIASWSEDMEGYFRNMKRPIPEDVDWKLFANILIGAKMYE